MGRNKRSVVFAFPLLRASTRYLSLLSFDFMSGADVPRVTRKQHNAFLSHLASSCIRGFLRAKRPAGLGGQPCDDTGPFPCLPSSDGVAAAAAAVRLIYELLSCVRCCDKTKVTLDLTAIALPSLDNETRGGEPSTGLRGCFVRLSSLVPLPERGLC